MSDAPKRVHIAFDNVTTPRVFGDGTFVRINADVPYIRADLADALAKALERHVEAEARVMEHHDVSDNLDREAMAMTHTALAAYREAK